MSYSAVISHHMVSRPRLLISLNSRRSMEGTFNPNLPPVFDVYPEKDTYYFNPELPPVFDESQVTEEPVEVSSYSYYKSPLEIHMAAKLDGYDQKDLAKNVVRTCCSLFCCSLASLNSLKSHTQPHHFFGSFNSRFSSDFSIKVAACAYFDVINKGVSTIIWVVRTKLVFDPGGYVSIMSYRRITKIRGQIFLKKWSMIRIMLVLLED